MQDPTEFRKRFLLYKEGKMPYENGRPKAIQKVDESNADFANRLRSNWRLEIWDWERSGKSVTHKIAGTDNIVYPNVQTTKGGGLIDFTHPMWKGNVNPYERAIKNNDYVSMDSEQDAIWFGPNYKDYYPGFKNGKLPGYKGGTSGDLNMGERSLLTSDGVVSLVLNMPHEQGLQNGPIEDAVAAYIGGKTISMINAYNNYRRLRNAKNTYRIYREANDNTKNAAGTGPAPRSWKIADADRYARTMLEGDTPLGFLYDIFVSPMSSLYTKMQRHPQIGPVMRLFE